MGNKSVENEKEGYRLMLGLSIQLLIGVSENWQGRRTEQCCGGRNRMGYRKPLTTAAGWW